MNGHIYFVENKINGKNYVGQSITARNKRGHGRLIRAAYKKHGFENFTYDKILTNIETREQLNAFERFWIAVFGSVVPDGYNIDLGGSEEQRWSDERRKRHCLALKGHRGWRRGLNLPSPNKGKKYPESGKEKLRQAMLGKPSPNWGRKASEETKAKMSAAQKNRFATQPHPHAGKKLSEETRAKMSAARQNYVATPETRAKQSAAVKAWHASRKKAVN